MKVKEILTRIYKMKEGVSAKVNYGYLKGLLVMAAIPAMLLNKTVAKADELGFLKNPAAGAFDSVSKSVKETGGSLYAVVRNIGLVVFMIGIVFIAMGIASNKNSNKRDEHKTQLGWYILGAIIFFGGFTIMAMAKKIASGITVD